MLCCSANVYSKPPRNNELSRIFTFYDFPGLISFSRTFQVLGKRKNSKDSKKRSVFVLDL